MVMDVTTTDRMEILLTVLGIATSIISAWIAFERYHSQNLNRNGPKLAVKEQSTREGTY